MDWCQLGALDFPLVPVEWLHPLLSSHPGSLSSPLRGLWRYGVLTLFGANLATHSSPQVEAMTRTPCSGSPCLSTHQQPSGRTSYPKEQNPGQNMVEAWQSLAHCRCQHKNSSYLRSNTPSDKITVRGGSPRVLAVWPIRELVGR